MPLDLVYVTILDIFGKFYKTQTNFDILTAVSTQTTKIWLDQYEWELLQSCEILTQGVVSLSFQIVAQ